VWKIRFHSVEKIGYVFHTMENTFPQHGKIEPVVPQHGKNRRPFSIVWKSFFHAMENGCLARGGLWG
jgi:hypothetical protein